MNLGRMLLDDLMNKEESQKVIDTFPAKKEWVKELLAGKKAEKALYKEINRQHARQQELWAKIEQELDCFGTLRYNKEEKTIEEVE